MSSASSSGRTNQVRKRRSSSRTQKPIPYGITPRVARLVSLAMVGLSVLYVGQGLLKTREGVYSYGDLGAGMTQAEVRYILGTPTQVTGEGDDAVWTFISGETRQTVGFANGLAETISCEDRTDSPVACPATFGVALGTYENDIWSRLGAPTRQIYRGDAKTIVYDDLSVQFDLSRLSVERIQHRRNTAGRSYLLRLPRILLP